MSISATATLEPPPLPGSSAVGGAARFVAGMNGRDLLGIIFRVCRELTVSDIQMRSARPVYIHTNKGMEKLDYLGILSPAHLDEILKELISNRESASHGFGLDHSLDERIDEKIRLAIADFAKSRVADFSCDGVPMGENGGRSGRLRIQAHLSSSGLGITCRILSDSIPELEALGIDPDTTSTLRHCVLKRAGLCLVTGPTGSGKSTTLASLIDWLRRHHPKHIVTVEDPIEYQYPDAMDDPQCPGQRIPSPSIVTQQEVGRDVHTYRQGLKDVLRKAESLNAIKQRFLDRERHDEAAKVERFQDEADRPYVQRYGAIAHLDNENYETDVIDTATAAEHPFSALLFLVVIKGDDMMALVHELYRRAADEA